MARFAAIRRGTRLAKAIRAKDAGAGYECCSEEFEYRFERDRGVKLCGEWHGAAIADFHRRHYNQWAIWEQLNTHGSRGFFRGTLLRVRLRSTEVASARERHAGGGPEVRGAGGGAGHAGRAG